MQLDRPTIVECADGSVEIYEDSGKKTGSFLTFAAITLVSGGIIVYGQLAGDLVLRRLTPLGIGVTFVSLLLTLMLFPFKKKPEQKLCIKFTREGFSSYGTTAKWTDISKVHITQYECILLSRRAGEIYLNTIHLDVTPTELLEIVFKFAPELDESLN